MDMQTLVQLIGSLGFPIAACIACFWMLNKEREDRIAEMKEFTKAIDNNTLALEAIKNKLDNG